MTDDDGADELEFRLNAMLAGRAEAVESTLSGPELRGRAGRRPSAARRYGPPAAAAAAVAAIAVGIAMAGSGGGGHPSPAGGSPTTPPTGLQRTSSPSRTTAIHHASTRPAAPPIPQASTTATPVVPIGGRISQAVPSRGRRPSMAPSGPSASASGTAPLRRPTVSAASRTVSRPSS